MSSLAVELSPSQDPELEARLADGSVARVEQGVLKLHDREGRLLLRYADGHAEISAPNGDLVLAAPRGRVTVRSAEDVLIEANRDLLFRGHRKVRVQGGGNAEVAIEPDTVSVDASTLKVSVGHGHVQADSAELFSRHVATVAQRVVTRAEVVEVEAQRLVEKAKDAFCDVKGLFQQRVGRMRTLVNDVLTVRSRRTVMNSTEDTSIDGERILLG